jgi:hypothetical protein
MLSIFGIIAIVIFTIQVYKTAAGTERNAAVWAVVNAVTGVILQFIIPIFIGMGIGIYYMMSGSSVETLQTDIFWPAIVVSIVFLAISIAAMFLILKHVGKIADAPMGMTEGPPPPPTF